MKRSDWGVRKKEYFSQPRIGVEYLPGRSSTHFGLDEFFFSLFLPPIASLHWGLFILNPFGIFFVAKDSV
jgi:hypothetical protein